MPASSPQLVPDQAFVQAGQTMVRAWVDFISAQQALLQHNSQTAPRLPMIESEELTRLQRDFLQRHAQLWSAMLQSKPNQAHPAVAPANPADRRFAAAEWSKSPFYDYLRQAYLINAAFLSSVAEAMPVDEGVAKNRLRFLTRQFVEALAPSNFAATNPEFVSAALETEGESITAGIKNLIADLAKGRVSMTDESAFEVGRNLAITPGAVVFENDLFQLIQYAPLTEKVAERPLLIVPPCINKFYILDLQPQNSFVRYAVEQGITVFLMSWRNVKSDLAHLTWDDYLEQGALTALRVTREISRVSKINALGFCVGGTILSSALAVSKARGEDPVASLTLLTTLLDFSDCGDIANFVDETSVAAREATIGKGGLLRGMEIAAAFSSLRPNDLIWQYVVGNYLKGGKPSAFDLLYWNSDSTNLPGPFVTWYLRHLYLNNNLRVPGKLEMCGVRADLSRVDMPAYILSTREDHIVPWQSSYRTRQLLGGDTRFVLGASGHIAGVINPAAKNRRSYWTNPEALASSSEWIAGATENAGSWWPDWEQWLAQFGGKQRAARVRLGSRNYQPGEPAPGRYVKEKA